jgi:hypothetical protein
MENSDRRKSIEKQIKNIPVERVCFQINQGYKKCAKSLLKQQPNYDLCHAYKMCFKHALNQGYRRILVMEDDCIFDEKIHDSEILNDIREFIMRKDPEVYNLGPLPMIPNPLSLMYNHYHTLFQQSTHCVIYSDTYMRKFIQIENIPLGHIDVYNQITTRMFCYKTPLAYQTYTKTENTSTWPHGYDTIARVVIKPLQLDTKPQHGFHVLYFIGKLISLLTTMMILLSIMYIFLKTTRAVKKR